MMDKIMLISSKDNNFYNFRSELILELRNIGYEVIWFARMGRKWISLLRKAVDLLIFQWIGEGLIFSMILN